MTEWQLPVRSFGAAGFWFAGPAGAGLGAACSGAGFCPVWSARAWLVTSGTVRNE
jgi:hypothetical protein